VNVEFVFVSDSRLPQLFSKPDLFHNHLTTVNSYKKVNQSRYRSGVAQRVPGS